MTGDYYILEGDEVSAVDMLHWAKWFESADRIIERTIGEFHVVSTVFLGLDHQFGDGPPLLFETMVFTRSAWDKGPLIGQDCKRYSTLKEARQGHKIICDEWKVED